MEGANSGGISMQTLLFSIFTYPRSAKMEYRVSALHLIDLKNDAEGSDKNGAKDLRSFMNFNKRAREQQMEL